MGLTSAPTPLGGWGEVTSDRVKVKSCAKGTSLLWFHTRRCTLVCSPIRMQVPAKSSTLPTGEMLNRQEEIKWILAETH